MNCFDVSIRSLGRAYPERAGRERGAALLELCLVLPLLAVMIFGVIDFGRLIQARLILTGVSREGGNLASRDLKSGEDLVNVLKSSGTPLDLNGGGKIYITTIRAGYISKGIIYPPFVEDQVISGGGLPKASGISDGAPMGLTQAIYNHLVYNPANQAPDILGTSVVEVYYLYRPITPLPNFVQGLLLRDSVSIGGATVRGIIIGSRSVFCLAGN
jgi:hypothetical protein